MKTIGSASSEVIECNTRKVKISKDVIKAINEVIVLNIDIP